MKEHQEERRKKMKDNVKDTLDANQLTSFSKMERFGRNLFEILRQFIEYSLSIHNCLKKIYISFFKQ
jgi:hypothetical protein